jgi:DNA topoisomerase-1
VGLFSSQTEAKKNVTQAIKNVATQLGNRPATCRKYYVHPTILEAYLAGELLLLAEQSVLQSSNLSIPEGLSPEEQAVLGILEQYSQAQAA